MYPLCQHNPLLSCVPLPPPDACLRLALLACCFPCSLHIRSRDFRCHRPRIIGSALPLTTIFMPSSAIPKAGPVPLTGWSTVFIASAVTPPSQPTLVTSHIRHCQLAPTTCPVSVSVHLLRYARPCLPPGFLRSRHASTLSCS